MEKSSTEPIQLSIEDAYNIIRTKVFDPKLKRDMDFYDWDGYSKLNYNDILRVYYSYDFEKMENRTVISGKNDLKRYYFHKKVSSLVPYFYLIFFIIIIISFFKIESDSVSSWIILISLYLAVINLPLIFKTIFKNYKYISLR